MYEVNYNSQMYAIISTVIFVRRDCYVMLSMTG